MKNSLAVSTKRKSQQGFTLLEMVMVVFIMGILASVSLTFLETQNQQWRFDETERKLDSIGRALLFQPANQRLLMSGFVVDNGVLPPVADVGGDDKLEPLITHTKNFNKGTGDWFSDGASDTWATYAARVPIYQVKSGATDAQVLDASYSLHKGYRGGYLKEGVDSKQEVRDGWGEVFAVPTPAPAYTVDFAARAEFPALSKTLNVADWQTKLSSLEFNLRNQTGAPLDNSHVLAVLVFQNKKTADAKERWDTYHFTVATATPIADGDSQSFSAVSQSWLKNGVAVSAADLLNIELPPGEHMVVILPTVDFSAANPADFRRFKLYPRTLHDAIALDIKTPTPP